MQRFIQGFISWLRPLLSTAETITIANLYRLTLLRKHQLEAPALPVPESEIPTEPLDQALTVNVSSVRVEELTPVEKEMVIVAEEAAIVSSVKKPRNQRTALVEALLDEAHSQGAATYPQFMNYVKEQTGEACSKRAIANWKKSRGLISVEAA